MNISLKIIGLSFVLILTASAGRAQELRCNVNINTSKIQGTNKSVFTTLQSSLVELMNGTKWTNNAFAEQERIDCSFFITLTEQAGSSRYSGSLQVQARRPVYGTSYQTVTLNFMDEDFVIEYIEFDRIDFDLKTFTSNLSSIMAFYAYLILGIDYDSFALKGGNENFEKAQLVVNNAQKENYPGWNPYESSTRRNRYWIINNIIDAKYASERSAYYKYHRLGMDLMSEQPAAAREQIVVALKDIQKIFREKPDPYLLYLRMFFDAKSDELANIFVEAPQTERTEVHKILTEVDNNNSKKYDKIQKGTNLRF
ncbi:MAG: DUF4835 family protein [Prevotellaceae bacterium]|jgi:hypothetical protein|nr:DUF4835 family protein [Prevotellaceae bacterium]